MEDFCEKLNVDVFLNPNKETFFNFDSKYSLDIHNFIVGFCNTLIQVRRAITVKKFLSPMLMLILVHWIPTGRK